MAIINLRDYYPFYQLDQFVEVPDELVIEMQQWKRDEKAYLRKRNRHQAYFSLDKNSGMERDVLFVSITPDEHYGRRLSYKQLYRALSSLQDKQAKRITAHYMLGISQADIARAEGVSRNVVSASIRRGLRTLAEILKNI